MKYKSVIFAVHTDGEKPYIANDIMELCVSAWFVYDLKKMACICFGIIPDALDIEVIRQKIIFFDGYIIDEIEYAQNYNILNITLDSLNNDKPLQSEGV